MIPLLQVKSPLGFLKTLSKLLLPARNISKLNQSIIKITLVFMLDKKEKRQSGPISVQRLTEFGDCIFKR